MDENNALINIGELSRAAFERSGSEEISESTKRLGRHFEKAVYRFARTLDASAEVFFDHKVPDRDTGELRQCDVWINTKFGGHWPQSILVSCKDHKRKLHAGDIGTFCDEKRSSNATMGVIYSRSGFTKPAVEKARANQVSCCRLYDNEPVGLPDSIWIEQFACKPAVTISVVSGFANPKFKVWNDLFVLPGDESEQTLLDVIALAFSECEAKGISILNEQPRQRAVSFPQDCGADIIFNLDGTEGLLRVGSRWKKYRARTEATLLQGSYCLTNRTFRGTMIWPSIDTWGATIGDAWQEVDVKDLPNSPNFVLTILSGSDVRSVLREKLGDKAPHRARAAT